MEAADYMKVSTGSANQGIIIAIRVREHGLKDGVSYQIKDLRWRPTLGHQGRLCICRFHATGLQPRFTVTLIAMIIPWFALPVDTFIYCLLEGYLAVYSLHSSSLQTPNLNVDHSAP
jgi:hypothetical protein